jgi:hypothetical protein
MRYFDALGTLNYLTPEHACRLYPALLTSMGDDGRDLPGTSFLLLLQRERGPA